MVCSSNITSGCRRRERISEQADYATCRRRVDGANPNGWQPQEKITVAEALAAYTTANAWAGFKDGKVGVLKPGALADFAVLSRDLFTVPPAEIIDVKVVRTVVGGREVYVAPAGARDRREKR